jgi:hypothetical protein
MDARTIVLLLTMIYWIFGTTAICLIVRWKDDFSIYERVLCVAFLLISGIWATYQTLIFLTY